jgi:hypothetical protein
VLSLPTGTAVGEDEIGQVCQIIKLAIENGVEVRQRLGTKGTGKI